MEALLIIGFLAITSLDLWVAGLVFFTERLKGWMGVAYWLTLFIAMTATVFMTGFFSYFANPNTQIFGWPIPRVVFQRDGPESPWLDFVGPTIVLAYPMNFALLMLIPSIVFLVIIRKHQPKAQALGETPPSN